MSMLRVPPRVSGCISSRPSGSPDGRQRALEFSQPIKWRVSYNAPHNVIDSIVKADGTLRRGGQELFSVMKRTRWTAAAHRLIKAADTDRASLSLH